MSAEVTKVGIISCSGEAIPEGTISRLATRRVLELLRPNATVTLCLPLFLAGNEAERSFAKTHPTITIDGCEKQCAKWVPGHGRRCRFSSDEMRAQMARCVAWMRAR